MKLSKLNRDVHRWGSILTALPIVVITITGVILQLKKDVAWVQPPTVRGSTNELRLSFAEILAAASMDPQAGIRSWEDVDRLDVRPGKGMVKVRAKNRWEVQLDLATGEILQTAYRRSDLIESIHDGSFFHDSVKLWLFLPAAVILFVLWVTGLWLFFLPYVAKWKRRAAKRKAAADGAS